MLQRMSYKESKRKRAQTCVKYAKLVLSNKSLRNENRMLKKVVNDFENVFRTITCPKCKGPFSQRGFMSPRMLTCGHTSCQNCYKTTKTTGVSCPLCQKITTVKSKKPPINLYLIDMMEKIGKIILTTKKKSKLINTSKSSSVTDDQLKNRNELSPPAKMAKFSQLTLTGLENLGNTCFMNACIQIMNATTPFSCLFLDDSIAQYKSKICKESLVEEFGKIVRCIRTHKYAFIAPRNFKVLISRYGFESDCQHDCQELLTSLLNHFHDEFKGEIKNETQCITCTKKSVASQEFFILNLPIPNSTKCSLNDCFKEFLKIERLGKRSKWNCSSCNAPREAEIRTELTKMPPIFIIALNRFKFGSGLCRKNNNLVTFPLDLFLPSGAEKKKKQYHLYGVINHFGSLNQGHYTASIFNDGVDKWINFDDKVIHEMSSLDIVTKSAYILFYALLPLATTEK
ncbi:ubiquitin carboxyl-terminal hydrolase 8-like [Biomphalaria glabrata]|uniref:Ubiquitin carboxyl-terminal hydrolase n=1 Tax=Biomphalaria glabrata TaxID=6526 RepID=A0A9W2YZ71_BIOGL|nr:ubiquitin carboxyl-terminal hydrolase 8-like [Biomphalaria glabrata]